MSLVVVSFGVFLLQNEQQFLKQEHLSLYALLWTDIARTLVSGSKVDNNKA